MIREVLPGEVSKSDSRIGKRRKLDEATVLKLHLALILGVVLKHRSPLMVSLKRQGNCHPAPVTQKHPAAVTRST